MRFFSLFLAIPGAVLLALIAINPGALLAGYVEYDFGPWQRLLTQARALCDYIRQTFIPHTPSMGVFTDGYAVSTGLLSPPTTVVAVLGLTIVTWCAWRVRRRFPSATGGWLFFLVAHAVESTILPLEMYYEHRNYLPSVGLLIAAASLARVLALRAGEAGIRGSRIAGGALVGLLLTLGLLTHGRALVWSDPVVLVRTERKHHPQSIRAVANYAAALRMMGDMHGARVSLHESLGAAASPRLRGQILLLMQSVSCAQHGVASVDAVSKAIDTIPPRLDLNTFLVLEVLTNEVRQQGCGDLTLAKMGEFLAHVADRAISQPDDFNQKWAMRNRAAMLFAEAGEWSRARREALLGWQPSTPGAGAASLVEILLVSGDLEGAQKIFDEAWVRTARQPHYRNELERIAPLLARERQSLGWNRRRLNPGTIPR